jgi:hypothetical protein
MRIEAQIVDFVPNKQNSLLLAKNYGDVYGEDPWFEKYRSEKCGRFFGQEFALDQDCPTPNCDTLKVGYPLEETAEKLMLEVQRTDALAKVVMNGNQIAGFGIGFPYSYEDFANQRYGTPKAKDEMLQMFRELGLTGSVYYISEVGLVPDIRGQRISSRLVDMMANDAKERGLGLLMRTIKSSPMVENAYRVGMGQIMGPRSVVARELVPNGTGMKVRKEIVVLDQVVRQLDPLNQDRVLFGSPPPNGK